MSLTRRAFVKSAGAAGVALGPAGRALAGARPAADGPNIVVIVVDSLRVDHAYGDRAHTPNLDLLLRDGLRFTHAFPEAMPTVPARYSLLTGRRSSPSAAGTTIAACRGPRAERRCTVSGRRSPAACGRPATGPAT